MTCFQLHVVQAEAKDIVEAVAEVMALKKVREDVSRHHRQ